MGAAEASRRSSDGPRLRTLSRREALSGLGAVAAVWSVAACGFGSDSSSSAPEPVVSSSAGQDVTLLVAAVSDETALVDLARAVVRAHSALARPLAPVIDRQLRHVTALRASLSDPPPLPHQTTPRVPKTRRAALAAVQRTTSDAADRRRDDCLAAESGLLARLLGSLAASHAVSAEAIGRSL